jgi:hypothetical protein
MYLLIKIILIRQSKDKGFAVPFTIILGLIMILLATVNIVKSNEENLTAIGQRNTSIALTAAEAGVAYYQNLINKNRVIAIYNNTGTTSWANNNSIPDIDFYNGCSGSGFSTANGFGSTAVTNATTAGWIGVPGGIGEYSFESYNYSSDTGTLVVKGRDRTTDQDASQARLEVQFDVQPGVLQGSGGAVKMTDDLNGFDPALWIGSHTFTLTNTGSDNFEVQGNIIISANDCDLSGTETLANTLGNATVDPRSLLATPSLPGSFNRITDIDEIKNKELPTGSHSFSFAGGVGGDQIAYYLIEGDLTLGTGDSIQVKKGSKVILFVQGDISFTGDVDLNQNAANTSDRLEIYGNSGAIGSETFGCATGVTCPTAQINLLGSDTIDIKAFIHAPAATLTISGGNDPQVNITGAIWVNGWNDASSNSKKITITPDDRYKDYTSIGIANGSSNLNVKPVIYPPKSWQTKEAN